MAMHIRRNTNELAYGIKEYILDTENDLQNLPSDAPVGSAALVLETGKIYAINSLGEWIWLNENLEEVYKGLDGKSAYEIAVANGFEGTESQWLASLVGAQGPQGSQGEQGPQGIQGIQGVQGPAGADGFSPEITLAEAGGTATISVTNKDGSTSEITIPYAPKGDKGDPGYTPVKGVDYFDGASGESGIPDMVEGTAETTVLPLNTVVEFGETAAIAITGYGEPEAGKAAEYILSFTALEGFQLSLPDTYPILWDAVPVWQIGCAYEVSLMLRNGSLYGMWAEFYAEVSA